MQALIKWPGGKTSELTIIKQYMPDKYDLYFEPFFGGGAVYFDLCPQKAVINDISSNLMQLYSFIGENNILFKELCYAILSEWDLVKAFVDDKKEQLITYYVDFRENKLEKDELKLVLADFSEKCVNAVMSVGLNFKPELLNRELNRTLFDKFSRTVKNEMKRGTFEKDLIDNIITGFLAGYYMYQRGILNDSESGKLKYISKEYKIAVYLFVREFCYGSMFRYNSSGEFNIPYGGIGYNGKDYKKKLDYMFSDEVVNLLSSADIHTVDFEQIISLANKDDFVFLDPPYDTDFSDYEAVSFSKTEHMRLAECLFRTKAKFLLIIKNTPFIYKLYADRGLTVHTFDNTYAYCVKGRNDRNVEHLIITNY